MFSVSNNPLKFPVKSIIHIVAVVRFTTLPTINDLYLCKPLPICLLRLCLNQCTYYEFHYYYHFLTLIISVTTELCNNIQARLSLLENSF